VTKKRPTRRYDRREFLGLGAGLSATALLAACGGGGATNNPSVQNQSGGTFGTGDTYDGPKVELDFWNGFTGGDGPFMQKLIGDFQAENDNIAVKMNTVEWDTYYQKVPAAVQVGKGPDIGIMHIDQLPTNAARNVIVPLDDLATALDLTKDDFSPEVWDAGIYNDARYGVPLDVHPLAFFYNRTTMEKGGLDPNKPPQTKDELTSALEQLKSQDIQGMWISPFLFTGGFMWMTVTWQNGGDLYNSDATSAAFNSEQGVSALEWLVSLSEDGYSPRNVAQDAENIAFMDGRNAFVWNGVWNINPYDDAENLDWGVARIPRIGQQDATWGGSHNFVIMNKPEQDTNKLEASKVFISWVSQHSADWAKAGQVPARQSVQESQAFKQLGPQSIVASQLPDVHFQPPVPGIGDAVPILEAAVGDAVLLKSSPEDALAEAEQQVNQLLEENAEKYGS